MIQKVERFKTSDGSEFADEAKAHTYEKRYLEVQEFMDLYVPKRFRTCNFANGEGFIQFKPSTVLEMRAKFDSMLKRFHPGIYKEVKNTLGGYAGRWLSDSNSVIYGLWDILNRIDEQGRLWGQQYYRDNPTAAPLQKALNKTAI